MISLFMWDLFVKKFEKRIRNTQELIMNRPATMVSIALVMTIGIFKNILLYTCYAVVL